jgi:hypothetical protein
MTPKEKAKELFEKYCLAIKTDETDSGYFTNVLYAKQCALIAVDEMLDFRNGLYINEGSLAHQWLIDVKHEIEKL